MTFLFPALSRIPTPNSTASFLSQTPYRPISALTPPPFPFLFLPSAINCIQDYYFLTLQVWTQKCAVQKASVDVNISYY